MWAVCEHFLLCVPMKFPITIEQSFSTQVLWKIHIFPLQLNMNHDALRGNFSVFRFFFLAGKNSTLCSHVERSSATAIEISKHFERRTFWMKSSAAFCALNCEFLVSNFLTHTHTYRDVVSMRANTLHVRIIIYILLGKSAKKWIALSENPAHFHRKNEIVFKTQTIKPGNKEQFTFPFWCVRVSFFFFFFFCAFAQAEHFFRNILAI